MTTGNVSEKSSTGATLSGSYSGASGTVSETGFYWGTSASSLTNELQAGSGSGASGNFSQVLTGLEPSTTYYYKAYVLEYNESTSSDEYKYGEVRSFTTQTGWLELPAQTTSLSAKIYNVVVGANRNYSFLYDQTKYASLWVAYPLASGHMGSLSRDDSWASYPGIDTQYQINIWSGSYGVSVATPNYPNNLYARGHQIANADRNGNETMQIQTFYAINSTPQIQYGFNSGIWSSLEGAVRSAVPASDTLYVVTGPVYQTVGGNEEITYITPNKDQTKSCPVPNYYFKVILKVKRSGDIITSASTIGFWLEHKEYTTSTYSDYAVSVDEIEEKTGFDFFANLPDSIETAAEANTNWTTFQNF